MPKNNEQSTTNVTQNKPNQTQFQAPKQLTLLAGREIAAALGASQWPSRGETVRGFGSRAWKPVPRGRSEESGWDKGAAQKAEKGGYRSGDLYHCSALRYVCKVAEIMLLTEWFFLR